MATESTLRYLKLDYQSHKDALLQRIRERWPIAWNDFLANSIGIVLVDIVAWGLATTAYVINRIGGENFVSTMTLRESAVRLGSLTGYQLQSPVPAIVSCEATLSAAISGSVTIQKGTLIRTSDNVGLPFEVVQDYVIEAGDTTPKTLMATFSPSLAGPTVLNTFILLTQGSVNADCVDTTINLSEFIQAGQTLNKLGDATVYTITSLEQAPGSISPYSRMVLERPYEGTTESTDAEVYDRRIALVQGQTIIDNFIAPVGGTPSFSVKLSRAPVMDDSVTVTVNGVVWTEVTTTAVRDAEATVYEVRTMPAGQTVVIFGDDSYGAAVPSEAAIEVNYRIGGGTAGNITLNTINTSIAGLNVSLNSSVPVLITNATSSGSGGQEAETLEQARINIPAYTQTNDRAVTLSDYQTIAQQFSSPQFGSVTYARSTVRTENALLEGNIVVIYAWTTGSGGGLVTLSPPLKQALQTYMQTKAMGTDLVQIYDGTSRPVPISLRFKTLTNFNISSTKQLVNDTIKSFVNALRPGDPILYSNLMRALDSVYGVDTVQMATPTTDLFPANTTELFSVPQDTFVYSIQRQGAGVPQTDANGASVSPYTAQLPIFPSAAWSMQLFLGTDELTIMPDVDAGYARVLGTNLSSDPSSTFWSRINLLTGQATLWLKGAPGDLTMQLVTVQGYSTERVVNLYVGYTGDNTQTKRREIRSALRAYSDQLSIGGSIYAANVPNISASTVSVTDVVSSVSGVTTVTRVALDSPASSAVRITAADYELLRIGNVYLNNQVD